MEIGGRIGNARAVEALIAALKDKDGDVRKKAAEALDKMGWQPKDTTEKAWFLVAFKKWSEAGRLGASAVTPLMAVLKDGEQRVRWVAAQTLGKIGEPAVEPLIEEMKNNNEGVRKVAAKTLGWIKDARAVDSLIAGLKDRDWEVRKFAAEALGRMKDTRAAEPLVAALKDGYLRRGAAWALCKIGDASTIEPMIAILEDEDELIRNIAICQNDPS